MKLLIAGAGGHGRVVADAAACAGLWSEIAFLDDTYPDNRSAWPWSVVGRLDDIERLHERFGDFCAGLGNAGLRLSILSVAMRHGYRCPPIVHSRATVSEHAKVGAGTVIFAGAVVNIGAALGVGCIINTGATVDHDCCLADGVHVSPGAHLAGHVSIGRNSWFGIGAVAKQGISIGANVTVGAAAVCLQDIPDNVTVVGTPAKELKR